MITTYDIYTSPADNRRLLSDYDTWKAVSMELKLLGYDDIHEKIERSLAGFRGMLGIYIVFDYDEVAAILRTARIMN